MEQKKIDILKKYEKGGNLVLSTSSNDVVTSRMISVIVVDDALYFTSIKRDNNMKNDQIESNGNVALCDMSRQMTGTAHILGMLDDPEFSNILGKYKKVLPDSYAKFGNQDCLLIKIDIKTFKDFTFEDGKPKVINLTF